MKKKVLALLVAAMSGSLLSGCGAKQQTGAEAKSSIGEEEKADEASKTETSSEEAASDENEKVLSRVYKIPMEDIYIDAPGWLKAIDEDVTEMYVIYQSRLYAITYTPDFMLDQVHSLEDAQEEFNSELDISLDNYEGGFNSLDVTSDKNVTINDIDMYYFEGTINYGRSDVDIFDGYTVGYTFIIDGQPVQIIGSVTDKSQPEGLKQEVKATVDAMAESVRTEE